MTEHDAEHPKRRHRAEKKYPTPLNPMNNPIKSNSPDVAGCQRRLVRKSSYVVMKAMRGLWSEHWDVHCVCEDRKSAKAECNLRNSRSRKNTYFVKCVPFIANAEIADA
jgi:hypothetical protein